MIEQLRLGTYRFLVNKAPGIESRYQRLRKKYPGKAGRAAGILAVLWWNLLFYAGGKKRLQFPEDYGYYEKRRLYMPESSLTRLPSRREMTDMLLKYDVISFDIFDTLLLRPFREPEGLFYLVGMKLSVPDFRRLRTEAERLAREEDRRKGGSGEVTLGQIWEILGPMTGIDTQKGAETERETERTFCMANPYFLPVVRELKKAGKTVVAASDMYLERGYLEDLLEEKGFPGLDGCFVSCDLGASKWQGGMYAEIRRRAKREKKCRMIHVGDNRLSDIRMAKRQGFHTFWYPNPQESGRPFRPADMSAVTGSIYGGLVNIRLHSGLGRYTPFYEYGYVYGGILALGYCRFIHSFVQRKKIQRIWFLARDGEILKKVYDSIYPGEDTVYVLWSRSAAFRLLSDNCRHEYFQRFLFQKVNQGYTIRQIFSSMELSFMERDACRKMKCSLADILTEKRALQCREYLLSRWQEVQDAYQKEREAAGKYLSGLSSGAEVMAAVDVGWTGSGAATLNVFLQKVLRLPCRICGVLAGTATVHSASPDTAEGFFFSGQMASYLFSQSKNRDLWKFHNLNKKHNLYMELLFTSPSPTLRGFGTGPDGEVVFRYGRQEKHQEQIRKIQKGILDFVRDYGNSFPEFLEGEEGWISGRDAYAPFLLFLGDKRAQKRFERSFIWDTDVNVE